MASQQYKKLLKVFKRYKYIFFGGLLFTFLIIGIAFCIFFAIDKTDKNDVALGKVAEFLLDIGKTLLGTIVLGGGLGTMLNLVLEKVEQEENEIKEKIKDRQEQQEKNKHFRWEMQRKLQEAHDHVELARILIKSHKSGKTYGEQIRNRIMPSLITLQEFKRRLTYAEDRALVKNIDYLNVSLTYMIAYLSVLIEEFEAKYLEISNLQNYQDAIANRMRAIFTGITEEEKADSAEAQKNLLERTEEVFDLDKIPAKLEIVWQELEKLYYVSDFIKELRNNKGTRSLYHKNFLTHYFHCLKMLKSHNSIVNQSLVDGNFFQSNLAQLKDIEKIKESDQPLTKQDSLIRKIMIEELSFNFETGTHSSS